MTLYKKALLVISFFLLVQSKINAQQYEFGVEVAYQWYYMHDLKTINDYTYNSLPFEASLSDNYPAFLNYSPYASMHVYKPLCVGVKYTFLSSGSRISRKDYSGEYLFDNNIRGHAPALFIDLELWRIKKFTISVINEVGYIYTKLEYREYLNVSNVETTDDTYKFKSSNFYWNPTFSFDYPIYSDLDMKLGLKAGYHFDFSRGDLKLDDNDDIVLQNTYEEAAEANWSGVDISLFISIGF